MKVLILTNGAYGDYAFCREDLEASGAYDWVICADRGIKHAIYLGLTPDLIVGDFDSGDLSDLEYYRSRQIPIEQFNPHKDQTDTEIAIRRAVEKGATSITVYGGVGTRLDHSLGNVQLLYPLMKVGIKARLLNPFNEIMLMEKYMNLQGSVGDTVSLLPFAGSAFGVTTKNLKYPLDEGTIKIGESLGISNVMLQNEAEIWAREGILIVIKARD